MSHRSLNPVPQTLFVAYSLTDKGLFARSYEEYVPVKKRRELEARKRLGLLGKASMSLLSSSSLASQVFSPHNQAPLLQSQQLATPSAPAAGEAGTAAEAVTGPEAPGNEMLPPPPVAVEKKSLLKQAAKAKKGKPEETENEQMLREEQELLRNITRQTALKGVKELAKVSI